MRRYWIIILLMSTSFSRAQVVFRINTGLASQAVKINLAEYNNVNWRPSGGVEAEKRIFTIPSKKDSLGLRPRPWLSLQAGLTYADNYADLNGVNVVETALMNYTYQLSSEINVRFIHFPILLKFHIPVSFFDERVSLNYALGLTTSFLLDMDLKEKSHERVYDTNWNYLTENFNESQGSVKDYAKKQVYYITFGMYFSHRKISAGFLVGFAPSDQYLKGLENDWSLSANESLYLGSYQAWPKVHYEYANFIIGYRLN